MNTLFLIGIIIFSLSAGYFSVFSKKTFNTSFLVSALMALSYTIMYSGLIETTNADGHILHWSRWVVYALSCSLLVYTMARKLEFKGEKIASTITLNIFVMLSGAAASVLTGWPMLVVFALSSFAYILMIKPILSDSRTTAAVKSLIYGGWGAFPIVFLLSHEGFGLIDNVVAVACYLVLDILTKIVYYFVSKSE